MAQGESYTLEIVGDLTIKDISKGIAFQATITLVSETRIEGSASTTISRSDYDLSIPSVPRVASVEEDLMLEFDFVAVPMS
jgi:polyisoprenoid-binding protein YceI